MQDRVDDMGWLDFLVSISHDIAAYMFASAGVVAGAGNKSGEKDGDKDCWDESKQQQQQQQQQQVVPQSDKKDRPLPGDQEVVQERREMIGRDEGIQGSPVGEDTQELAFHSGRKLPYGLLTHEQPQTHLLPYDSLLGMFRKRRRPEGKRGSDEGGNGRENGEIFAQQCGEEGGGGNKRPFNVMVPLCPWELRGVCKDVTCTFQHLEPRSDVKPDAGQNGAEFTDDGDEVNKGVPPYVAMEPGLPHQGGTGIVNGKISDSTHKIKKREFVPQVSAEAA